MQINLQPPNFEVGGPDPGAAMLKGYDDARARAVQEAQLQRQMKMQQLKDQFTLKAIQDPSIQNFTALTLLDPQSHEAIKTAWDKKDQDTQRTDLAELSAARGYLRAGQPDAAAAIVQKRIDADTKAGHDTTDDEQMLKLIQADPEKAAMAVDYSLFASLGGDKWADAFKASGDASRADKELPSKIAKNTAEATSADADAALKLSQAREVAPNAASDRRLAEARQADIASQIDTRSQQLQLDRDKLTSDVQLKLQELNQKGTQISGVSEQTMTSAVIASQTSRQLAAKANDLADKITSGGLGAGGVFASGTDAVKSAFGNPTMLRRQYEQLKNSQAIQNLPRGPASDKDVKFAMAGFPNMNASAETLSSFLRGMAKMQEYSANAQQAQADWISENGNLGKARRDIVVNGVKVPSGTSYGEFSTSEAATQRRQDVGDRSYMRFGR